MANTAFSVPDYVTPRRSKLVGVIGAAAFGGLLEFYLLYIAGLAAGEAWPSVFFISSTPALALILSIFAYLITYFVRPLGALFFGHYGDRIGRKSQLVVTILIVSLSSLIIGILPGYSAIGVSAPIILTLMRAVQGFGFGGEYGGASSIVAESVARTKWRYLLTSFVQIPISLGLTVGAFSFAFISVSMSHAAFLSIGWRIPFIVGSVIGAIGMVIRYRVMESPIFDKIKQARKVERSPVASAFRNHWKQIIILSVAIFPIAFAPMLTVPFGISYFIKLHMSGASVSYAYALYGFVPVVTMATSGIVATKIKRKKVFFLISSLAAAVVGGLFFVIAGSHPSVASVITAAGLLSVAVGWEWGLVPAVLPEQFPAVVRYTAAGFVLQFSQTVPAVIAVVSQSYLISAYNGVVGAAPYVALTYAITCVVAFVASLMIKETSGLEELAPLYEAEKQAQ